MRRLLAVLLLTAACSSEQPAPTNTSTAAEQPSTPAPPSAQQVRDLIGNSSEFGQHEFTNAAVSMPVSGAAMSEPTRDTARQLAAAGWIQFDGAGDIMLNERSRQDKRFLLRENGLLDVVPLAKKEMGEVVAVRQNPDGTVSADFSWRWLPNEVGKAFTTGLVADRFAATHNATAQLMWNGTEWVMLSVAAR
jgi:hypothetical protein